MAGSAALSQILDWGVDNISNTLGARNIHIAERARQMGLHVTDDKFRSPHYVALEFAGGVPEGFADRLAAEKIFVSVRGNSVRVTPHLYNRSADIDRLFAALGRVMGGT